MAAILLLVAIVLQTQHPALLAENAINWTIRVDTFLWLMRQPPQHFVLLKTLRLRAPAYDPVNGALYSVYPTLTIAPDFEPAHLNDTFAGREKQPFVSVE